MQQFPGVSPFGAGGSPLPGQQQPRPQVLAPVPVPPSPASPPMSPLPAQILPPAPPTTPALAPAPAPAQPRPTVQSRPRPKPPLPAPERAEPIVVPKAFSIYRIDASVSTSAVPALYMSDNPGDQVGLLRRLSVYPMYLDALMLETDKTDPMCVTWREYVVSKLFGYKTQDEFRGYGKYAMPGHDQLGRFPAYYDERGRQYFDHVVHTSSQTNPYQFLDPSIMPESVTMGLRIPRQITHNTPRIDFPRPGDVVTLRACGVPLWPFVWFSPDNDVRSIAEPAARRLWALQLSEAEQQAQLYRAYVHMRVVRVYEARDSTCAVDLAPVDAEKFRCAYTLVQAYRSEWSLHIIETFIGLLRGSVRLDLVLEFCKFLQTTWIQRLEHWVHKKHHAARA